MIPHYKMFVGLISNVHPMSRTNEFAMLVQSIEIV